MHLWAPPFANVELRRRVSRKARSLDELQSLLEQEGAADAERIAREGVALANGAGWAAQPLTDRNLSAEGFALARLAEELKPAAVVVGSRGLSGLRAVLGSVSDFVVHHSPAPVLVVPHPLLADEREAAAAGPVVVGHDGSSGAQRALATAASLFAAVSWSWRRPTRAPSTPGCWQGGCRRRRGRPARFARRRAERAGRRRGARRLRRRARAAVIVVGSRGQSAHRSILLGSVALAALTMPTGRFWSSRTRTASRAETGRRVASG